MSIRYIFATSGEYIAFLKGDNFFAPDSTWLGFLRDGNLVYDTDGNFLGHLTDDDRIIAQRSTNVRRRVLRPIRPMRPLRPLLPLRRLRMPTLPIGYYDVFDTASMPLSNEDFSNLRQLLDSDLVAQDGIFLGRVVSNKFDSLSLRNQFGPHGSRYAATSIFNPYSPYGSEYSALSTTNSYSQTPPRFVKGGKTLAFLTKNTFLSPQVDPEKFQAWLNQL